MLTSAASPELRRLVVNADDFGFTAGVNAGIVRACREGILRSATLMANGGAFGHAVRQAGECPELDIGVHCVLISGEMVSSPGDALPPSYAGLLRELAGALTAPRIEAELRAQIEKILSAGIQPTHIDTHKHTHLVPRVRGAVLRLAKEYGIRWVRSPFDVPLLAGGSAGSAKLQWFQRAVRPRRRQFEREIAAAGLRTTDHFAGFGLTGKLGAEGLLALLPQLPAGSTELMTHPGIHDAELERSRTRLKASRQMELEALTDPRVMAAISECQIEVCSFVGLS